MPEKSGNQKTPEQKDAGAHTSKRPKIAVVPGSNLGNLTADFTKTEELPYNDIPDFPMSAEFF